MASNIANIVKITAVKYADAIAGTTAPTTLKDLPLIQGGKLNFDFPEPSVTAYYAEQIDDPYYVSLGDVSRKVDSTIITPSLEQLAELFGGTYVAAVDPETEDHVDLKAADSITPKYVEIQGLNSEGIAIKVIIYNAKVVSSQSGTVSKTAEPLGYKIAFYAMANKSGLSTDPAIRIKALKKTA